MSGKTTAIRGAWVLGIEDGAPTILGDRWVVVEGDTIAGVVRDRPAAVDHLIELDQALVLPGFLNLHNHAISSILFRGLTEDIPTEAYASELVYGLLMPLGDLGTRTLSAADMRAVMALGFLELIKGGTTTLMEIFRLGQEGTFEAAEDMGLRFYGVPYLFSTTNIDLGADGVPTYQERAEDDTDLARCLALHRAHHDSAGGLIRVGLGPHGPDSCSRELLAAVRRAADELGCPINIHMAQSAAELALIRDRHGMSPAEYFDAAGLLGPDVIVAHCLYASDSDLDILKARGAAVASCPRTFARGGLGAAFHRFHAHGLRTVIATDGYCMDMVGELRAAGFVSKLQYEASGIAGAWDLVRAVTLDAADVLGRDDLGRIAPGARADLLVVDMAAAHLQPVSDPIKTFVWNAAAADISAVLVDGRVLVEGGRFALADERAIIDAGAAAVHKVWRTDEAAAIIARANAG